MSVPFRRFSHPQQGIKDGYGYGTAAFSTPNNNMWNREVCNGFF
jgi:hypothetical protein